MRPWIAFLGVIGQTVLGYSTSRYWLMKVTGFKVTTIEWIMIGAAIVFSLILLVIEIPVFRRKTRLYEKRLLSLQSQIDSAAQQFSSIFGARLRINIMLPERHFLTFLEPCKNNRSGRVSHFFPTVLYIRVKSQNMKICKDAGTAFTTNQGCCGQAFTMGSVYYADLTETSPLSFNLNEQQAALTNDLTFVASCPIFDMEPDKGNVRFNKRVIGVLNIDSNEENIMKRLKTESRLEQLLEKGTALADACGYLL